MDWIIDMTDDEQMRGVCHIKIGSSVVREVPYEIAKQLVDFHNNDINNPTHAVEV